jgi:hypothetical protein
MGGTKGLFDVNHSLPHLVGMMAEDNLGGSEKIS